jgi:hypothetical protein
MKLEFSRQNFEKFPNIKFLKIRQQGAEVHADRQTDRQTDMTKLLVAFRNFANAPKIENNKFCLNEPFYISLKEWRRNETKVAEEYWWAITLHEAVILRPITFHYFVV